MVQVIELFGRMETTYECKYKDVSRVCTLQINTFIVQIETQKYTTLEKQFWKETVHISEKIHLY